MSYIVFFPRHDKGGGIKFLGGGKVELGRVKHYKARALYKRVDMPEHRYVSWFPLPTSRELYLALFDTQEEAVRERDALRMTCGEEFEIRLYEEGRVGARVDW